MSASVGIIIPTRGHFDYALSAIGSVARASQHAYPHRACTHGTRSEERHGGPCPPYEKAKHGTLRTGNSQWHPERGHGGPCPPYKTEDGIHAESARPESRTGNSQWHPEGDDHVVVILVDDASSDWRGDEVMTGLMPESSPWVIVRFHCHGGLSRSWNAGLHAARSMGLEFAVCGNSDLLFSRDWWGGIEQTLETFDFAGPVTNAPGHIPLQDITRYLPGYEADDDLDAVDGVGRALAERRLEPMGRSMLNGFCIAGRVESFFNVAGNSGEVFLESIPMEGNEDDFFERAKSRGMRSAIAPGSFVFHYRSVTRGLRRRGLDRGAYRTGCGGCRR